MTMMTIIFEGGRLRMQMLQLDDKYNENKETFSRLHWPKVQMPASHIRVRVMSFKDDARYAKPALVIHFF